MSAERSQWILRLANTVIAGTALLCVLVVVSAELSRSFPVLYLISASIALTLLAALRTRPDTRINLALSLVAIGFSLFIADLFLSAMDRSWARNRTIWTPSSARELHDVVQLAERAGVRYDTRGKFQVLSDRHESDPGAVPAIVARALLVPQEDGSVRSLISLDGREALPLGGVSRATTVFCNEAGEWITYVSDEHGFNNPADIWQSDEVDVVLIGDSFAQGTCVPSDRNVAALLRRHYPVTINLGMLGSGPLIELAQLKEYAAKLRPRIVLWFFFEGNDISGLEYERGSPLLMDYLAAAADQRLMSRQEEIDVALRQYVAAEIESHPELDPNVPQSAGGQSEEPGIRSSIPRELMLVSLRKRVRMAFTGDGTGGADALQPGGSAALLSQVFRTAKTEVVSWGGELFLVYLPERDRYVYGGASNGDEMHRQQVLEIAMALDIPVIDIHDVLAAHDDPLSFYPFRRRGHFNEQGYRLIADSIMKVLVAGEVVSQ